MIRDPPPPSHRSLLPWALAAGGVVVVITLVGVWFASRLRGPAISRDEVQAAVFATLPREAPASFLVTGELDLTATATVRSTRYLLPDLLRLRLGSSSATVRMPGRASYGFDIRQLRPEMIEVGDSIIEVTVPPLRLYALEPNLSAMEVETIEGWKPLAPASRDAQQEAFQRVEEAMRSQARAHLRGSEQPGINTARALEAMLAPALAAAGVRRPSFRFIVGRGVSLEGG